MSRSSPNNFTLRMAQGAFRAFSNESYRFFWTANFLAYTSRWMQMTILAWLVLELTDSPWLVSLIGFFLWIPMLLLGLMGGLLADSVNRRTLLCTIQTVASVASLGMMALLFTDYIEFWHAYAAISLTGISWALDMPSRNSVIHDLWGTDGVTHAVALDMVGMNGSRMVGPALAGLLIVLVDVKGSYIAVSIFQLLSLVFLWLAEIPTGHAERFATGRLIRNVKEGLNYTRTRGVLMATVAVTIAMNLTVFPYMHLVPVIARDLLNVGPGLMGLLQSADGMGALAGSLLIASLPALRHHGRVFIGGSALGLLALLAFSFSKWYGLSFTTLLVLGLGTGGFAATQMTIVMLVAKKEMRGVSLGVISLAIGVSPFGSLLIGGVASVIGSALAITISATMGLVSLGIIALLMSTLWRDATAEVWDSSSTYEAALDSRPAD